MGKPKGQSKDCTELPSVMRAVDSQMTKSIWGVDAIQNSLKKYKFLLPIYKSRKVIEISAGSVLLLRLTYSLGTTAYLMA